MKYYAILIIGCLIFSCEGPPTDQKDANDSQFPFSLAEGDSIPLDFAIEQYDSLFSEKNSTDLPTSLDLNVKLDSLNAELALDPENNMLKFEINSIKETLDEISLIEKVMNDIVSRDSLIRQLIPDFDSIISVPKED